MTHVPRAVVDLSERQLHDTRLDRRDVVTVDADDLGQRHFAYLRQLLCRATSRKP